MKFLIRTKQEHDSLFKIRHFMFEEDMEGGGVCVCVGGGGGGANDVDCTWRAHITKVDVLLTSETRINVSPNSE